MKKCMVIASCALLLLAAGCKKNSDNEPAAPQPQPVQPTTLYGTIEQPDWTASSSYDLASSMTAVVSVDLKAQFPTLATDFVIDENDLLAAYAGDICMGVIDPDADLFFLYVAAPATGAPAVVTLRYYSAHYKNIFYAKDAFPFRNDTQLGTVNAPYSPTWIVAP